MSDRKTHTEPNRLGAGPILLLITAALSVALIVVAGVLDVKVHRLETQLADSKKEATQNKSNADRLQSELDKTKTTVSEAQDQLNRAKADLVTQQNMTKEAEAQSRSQLAKEKGASAELLSQVDEEKSHTADLRKQLDQAVASSAQQDAQLAQAKIQTSDLQARLQKAESDLGELQPLLAKARHLPVSTSLDRSGHGNTLHIANLTLQPLSIDVAIADGSQTHSQHQVIGGGGSQDIGRLSTGQNVTISSDGYDPIKLTVQ